MWKCMRCEKENQDTAENCVTCGHGKTMDYTGYHVISKLGLNIVDNWRYNQNDPEYFRKQAVEHLQKATEFLTKSGLSRPAEKIKEVIAEVNKSSVLNKNPNIQIMENTHRTEQNISSFRYGGQNVLGADNSSKEEKNQNAHQTEQNTSPFRYGGQNVLGYNKSNTDKKKAQTRRVPKALRILNQSEVDNCKNKRIYKGKYIREICQDFLSYKDIQSINTGQKDNIISTLKIPSYDIIYIIHDDSWFKRGIEGFAVTSRGIYSRQARCQELFISWKEFKECTEITIKRSRDAILLDKKEIFTGFYATLHIELLFIALYKMLNEEVSDIDFEKELEESLRDL